MIETINLSEGYRIEIEPMVMPPGEFGARLFKPPLGGRGRWKQVGRIVVSGTAEQAAVDLLRVLNEGLMPDVEVQA